MDIPMNTQVECSDGRCGTSTYVVLNPVTDKVTYLVVAESASPHTERLVPLERIASADADAIRLDCSTAELADMEGFVETDFVQVNLQDSEYGEAGYLPDLFFTLPYVIPEGPHNVPVERERIPPEQLAVRRNARVEATDGSVGRVDEFVVDPDSGHITHLVLKEGPFWNKKDVAVPVSAIADVDEERVKLNLSENDVAELPEFPLKRRR